MDVAEEALYRSLREFKLANASCDDPEQARWLHAAIAEAAGGEAAFEAAVRGLGLGLGRNFGSSSRPPPPLGRHDAAAHSDSAPPTAGGITESNVAASGYEAWLEGVNDEYGLPGAHQLQRPVLQGAGCRSFGWAQQAPRIAPDAVSVEQQRQRNKNYKRVMLS